MSLLFPLTSWGQQGGGQQITSGSFSFVQIPDDAIFSIVEASDQEQKVAWSYVTSPSGLPSDSRNLLIVEDLRDNGGFRIDVEMTQYQHINSGLPLDLEGGTNGGTAMLIATEAPGNYGTIVSSAGVGYDTANTGPTDVSAPLDLAGANAENTANYATNLSSPVTLMDGPMPTGQGRTGQFQIAVNLVSRVSPFAPAGIYESQMVYTAYESTSDAGGDLAADPFDPVDDSGAGATLILPPDTGQVDWGMHTLSSTDLEDWYAIDLIAGEALNLAATTTTGAVTLTLCEDTSCAVPVAGNTPSVTGRYYIRATEDTSGNARYGLQYSYVEQQADAYDPTDDTCAGATTLSPTGTEQVHGLHTLSATDTEDWFRFDAAVAQLYNFNSIISNGIAQIEIWDSCAGSSFNSDISGGGSASTGSYFYLNAEDLMSQYYYLKVSSVIPSADVTYNLYYSQGILGAGEHADDIFDHTLSGDDRGLSTPTPLTITGVTQSHTGHTLTPSDITDMFSFSAVSGNVYNFTSVNTYGDLAVEILDSGFSNVETSSNLSGDFNHDFSAPTTDTYYALVRANDNADGKVAAYDLEYTDLGAGAGCSDSNEPDDTGAQAALVVPSGDLSTSTPHCLTSGSDTADWFAFDLTAGNEYTFSTTNNTLGDPVCYLYSDIDGIVQENDSVADDNAGGVNNCQTVFTPSVSQRYYYRIVEAAAGDAVYDFNYQTTSVSCGNSFTSLGSPITSYQESGPNTIDSVVTQNLFSVDLEAGITYNFNTIDTGATGLTLEVYSDSCLTTLLASDAASAGGPMGGVSLDYTAEFNGAHYLKMTKSVGYDITYDLAYWDVSSGGLSDDGSDPVDNSRLLTPTYVGIPEADPRTHLTHTLNTSDGFDWFTATLDSGSTYVFSTAGGTGDTLIDGFRNEGVVEGYDNDTAGSGMAELTVTPSYSGSYHIRVRNWDMVAGSSAYDLSYWCSAGCTFPYVALNAPTTTVQESANQTVTDNDNEIIFSVPLTLGSTYNFHSISQTGANAALNAELYSDQYLTNLVASNDNSGDSTGAFSLDYLAEATQTYYLRVKKDALGANITFNVDYWDASASHANDDGFDPADNSLLLTPTNLGTPPSGGATDASHTLYDTDHFDWFEFSLTAGDTYNFASVPGFGDPYADLFDSSGNRVAFDDNSGGGQDFSIDYTADITDTYRLRVRSFALTSAGYDLSYSCTAGACGAGGNDEYDPTDDTGLGATALFPSTTPQTHFGHTLSATDLYDWYALDLSAGQEYTFYTTGVGDTRCDLYDSIDGAGDGVTLLNDPAADDDAGDGSNCSTTYTAASTKTYYYRVHGFTLGDSISYDFVYQENVSADAYDPTDDVASGATSLTPTTTEQSHATHTLSATDTYDFFSATLTSGTTYNFNTIGAASGDTYIEIYDNVSALIPDDRVGEDPGFDQTSNQANLNFTPSSTGTYYIAVRTDVVGSDASYDFKYREVLPADLDAYDPGDDKATYVGADPINLGAPTGVEQSHGPHTLSDVDLYDWYQFTLTSGVTYNFNAVGGSGDNYASLYSDAAGTTEVAFDDDAGGGLMFSLTYVPGSTGTYYLRVRKFGVTGTSSYDLKYSSL